jgi:hypothetical protein
MRHFMIITGLAALLACSVQAQNTNLAFTPGKLVVLRAGDGIITIKTGRQHPDFIDEYDPALANQAGPLLSLELPTNGPNAIFGNAHAGSEGQGMTRSADRQYLTVCGYCGNINSISGTPSSATNAANPDGYPRGFGLIDAFTNFNVTYASTFWYGQPPGVSQDNPRGIATDGSNDFWGCGTVAGNQTGGIVAETGTLFWNGNENPDPGPIQNEVDSAYFMRIINDTLYMVCQTGTGGAQNNGVYTFQEFDVFGGTPEPLPWLPGSDDEGDTLTTNLFINFGPAYANILTFDMNPAGTIAYAADETYGIVKFVNNGAGSWTSPYLFNSNNIGSGVGSTYGIPVHPGGSTGCYGIVVDFSGTNPVIYATTTEEGDGANLCSNRLISIVDTGTAPNSTSIVATTLAQCGSINECFRGLDFAPDLGPAITTQPLPVNTTTNQTVALSVGTQSVFPLSFQWQNNGTNVGNNSTTSGATSSALTITAAVVSNGGNYTVIVSNQYGIVTSAVANVFVSPVPVLPSLSNPVEDVTNFIGNNQSFSVSPGGTPPFTYQWYFGNTQLVDDGVKYSGSTNSSLYITNIQLSDSGNYYLTVSNQAGGISNLVAVLTVKYVLPAIPTNGEPASATILQGQNTSLSVTGAEGTAPLAYQWYQGTISDPLSDANEFSGSATSSLTITGATLSDAKSYFCVVSNAGGSITSSVASVTVLVPPALSYVAYSNQLYFQNFDSLPNPGATPVNTIGGGGPTTIGGITYDVGNPFDFAFPLYTNLTGTPAGGLNLAATLPGWYGECDADTAGGQLGAADGSTTTGGIYSFGLTNGNTANRALGLIATSTSGGTHFGLKLINETTNNLNYISLQYTGEFWKTGSKPKTMVFTYNVDTAGNSSTLSAPELLASSNNPVSSLNVAFPTAGVVGPTNGTLAVNQTNLAVTNLALASPWQPGSALWLVWSIDDATGSGQGYGIDNFNLYASGTNVLTQANSFLLTGVAYSSSSGLSFGFSAAPGFSSQLSVRTTTDLALPLSQWVNLGNPTEVSFGNYHFTDAQATENAQRFYTVTSP